MITIDLKKIKNDPSFSPRNSQEWFIRKVKELTGGTKISSMQMLDAKFQHQVHRNKNIVPGKMYMFVYSPKHRETLPLYDKFPLILPFGKYPNGFIGLNLHYITPMSRMGLLDKLLEYANWNRNTGEVESIRLSWSFLQNVSKYPEVQPCVKRYLSGYVKSNFIEVPGVDWAMTLMLPTENFAKKKPW